MTQDSICNNTIQVIGPIYWKPINVTSYDFMYTMTKSFTEESSFNEQDLNIWKGLTRNIIRNEGSYVEKIVHFGFRFLAIKVAFGVLSSVAPFLGVPLCVTEFGSYVALPLIGNTKNTVHIIDAVNAASSLAYDDTNILESLMGIGVGSMTGMPHLVSLSYSWLRLEGNQYVASIVPIYMISKVAQCDTKLGIKGAVVTEIFPTMYEMNMYESRAEETRGLYAVNAAALKLSPAVVRKIFTVSDIEESKQYWAGFSVFTPNSVVGLSGGLIEDIH